MKSSITLLALIMFFVSLPAVSAEESNKAEYKIVRKVIDDSIGWAMTKDLDRLFQIFANDDNLMIWWVSSIGGANGIEDIKRTAEKVWMTDDFKATSFEHRDLKINFSRDGNVVWFSCYLDDCAIWNGKESCIENARKTGVLEKRDGQWVIVQVHTSWPVDKIPDNVWEIVSRARKADKKESE